MRLNRKALLGTVAVVSLGGIAAGIAPQAHANDEVAWTWKSTIIEQINKTLDINFDINPVGVVHDEIMQIQIGDVRAESYVSGVYNLKPMSEQVIGVEGYKRSQKLTIEAGLEYYLKGSGDITNYQNSRTRNVVRTSVDTASTATGSTENTFRGKLDGKLKVSSESDKPAVFVGGAGAAAGYFTYPPLSGGVAGAGVIGAIGAGAIEEGDAAFAGELGGSSKTTYKTASTTNTTTEAISDTVNRASSERGYTYDFRGEGGGKIKYNVESEDITRFYGLYPDLQDATKELPKVTSNAVAFGNMISIESDTMVEEHSIQVLTDRNCGLNGEKSGNVGRGDCSVNFDNAAFDLDADYNLNDKLVNLDTKNHFHDVGLYVALASGAGLFTKADISAVSMVSDILNASVESTATAIGNLKSIDVSTGKNDNGVVLADITQVSVADVSALSVVGGGQRVECLSAPCKGGYGGIEIVNYNNLGGMTIAKSTATAIGNAVNISVSSGQKTTTTP
jgi:hypothetical protein